MSPSPPPAYAYPGGPRPAAPPSIAASLPAPAPAPVAPATASIHEKRLLRSGEEKSGRQELDLRIDRLWSENGFTFATLSVRNTSAFELDEITIKCTAFGEGHVNLDFREQTLLTRADGPMRPGFAKTLKIRLEKGGFSVREMSCSARGW